MKTLFVVISIGIAMWSCKPEQTVPSIDESFKRYQKISLDKPDSITYLHIADKNEIEDPKLNQYYTWFKIDQINRTQGFFEGKLLEGEYLVLALDRSIMTKGNYIQGQRDGKWIKWYPNGNIRSAYEYKKDKRSGDFVRQSEAGQILQKGNYSEDKLDGLCIYYQADTVFLKVKYKKGIASDTIQ